MRNLISAHEFEALYQATAQDLFAYVRRRVSSDGEDIVAEAYAIAWRRRAQLPDPSIRRAWLFGIARNLLRGKARDQQAQARLIQAMRSTPTDSTLETVPDERSAAVAAALDRMSPPDREILQLVHWDGLTPAELAIALGVRAGTVRVRLHRARLAFAADPAVSCLIESALPTTM